MDNGRSSTEYAATRVKTDAVGIGAVQAATARSARDRAAGLPSVPSIAAQVATLGTISAVVLFVAAPDLPRAEPIEATVVLILFLALWLTETVSDNLEATEINSACPTRHRRKRNSVAQSGGGPAARRAVELSDF